MNLEYYYRIINSRLGKKLREVLNGLIPGLIPVPVPVRVPAGNGNRRPDPRIKR